MLTTLLTAMIKMIMSILVFFLGFYRGIHNGNGFKIDRVWPKRVLQEQMESV